MYKLKIAILTCIVMLSILFIYDKYMNCTEKFEFKRFIKDKIFLSVIVASIVYVLQDMMQNVKHDNTDILHTTSFDSFKQ